MRRLIYTACAALMILGGCTGYHPYYDGQKFRIYNEECGFIRTDGQHAYVPIADEEPFILDFYGGKGKNHTITVSDPDILDYSYTESDVKNTIGNPDIITAGITLLPKQIGDTSITITDDDTDESIQLFVHVCEVFKAIRICQGDSVFETGTVLAFSYPFEDDIVNIGTGNATEDDIEFYTTGRYRFFVDPEEERLYFEIIFPADGNGRPSVTGESSRKLYLVTNDDIPWYSYYTLMSRLRLSDYPLTYTKASGPETNNDDILFRFIDVTDKEKPDTGEISENESFCTYRARIIPKV